MTKTKVKPKSIRQYINAGKTLVERKNRAIELSEIAHVHFNTIMNYYYGKSKPTKYPVIKAISGFLRIKPDELIEEIENEANSGVHTK